MEAFRKRYMPILSLTFLLCSAQSLQSQSTPFLSNNEIRMLVNEISGDRAFEHIRWLTHWHRNSGSKGFFKAVDYVMQAAQEAGLEDVKFIEQKLNRRAYDAITGELWMVEPVKVKLADIGEHALYLADGSHDADLTAELAWIGDGSAKSLENVDVQGKIVLTSGSPGAAVRRAVWEKGAVGVVAYPVSTGKSMLDYPDQISWNRIPAKPPEGKSGTFAFVLPPRKGERLRRILETDGEQDYFATGTRTKGGRVVLKAIVDTEFGSEPQGRTGMIEGWIRGTKYHDQQIVITAHIQEEQGSANDDASGCANVLELARVFNKMIREGKMQRPLRDLRFWWTDEISSEYDYFAKFPGEPKKMLLNLHQDMSGAKQTMGNRVQHLIFAPHSRTSYLDAVFESIGTYLIQSNNGFLATLQAGGQYRYSKPIYSTRGTRDNYSAMFVPYFDNSDHRCFVEGIIGVPAVALINWPDDFIHSSDDDLKNVDQTQLRRNNFLIAATAYYLASAKADDVPLLAEETFSQGMRRMAKDQSVALRRIKEADSPEAGWKDANFIIEQGAEREGRALVSLRVFAANDAGAKKLIDTFQKRVRARQSQMLDDARAFYRQLHGVSPGAVRLSAEEKAASKKIPQNGELKTYFDTRSKIRFSGKLHGIMRDEVYNFVDGQRSYFDIYKAARAEALFGGKWYYGEVTLENVTGLLDAAVAAGALRLQ